MEPLTEVRDLPDLAPGVLQDLPAGEVHVWTVPVSGESGTLAHCRSVLSEEERRAADAFRRPEDMRRHVVAHGSLRFILAGYTGREPEALGFIRTEFGKPSLENGGSVRFNIAHSGDGVLVAVARGREIGVDMEYVKHQDDLPMIAARCFSVREIGLLRSCESSRYAETFYMLWARKEAYIKARGEGMSLDLTNIDIAEAPAVLDGRWHLVDIGSYRGCACALAADGPIDRVRVFGRVA